MVFRDLAGFLSGYLHQDYDLEFSSPSAAAYGFGSTEPRETVLLVLGEFAMFRAAGLDEAEIEFFLVASGCDCRPIESSLTAWIGSLEEQMGMAAWERCGG